MESSVPDLETAMLMQLENEILERVRKRISAEDESRQEEKTETPQDNHLYWNINAMSVLCWKGWDWPIKADWNSSEQRFENVRTHGLLRRRSNLQYITETHLLCYLLCVLPLLLVVMECNTLAGLNDQGSTLKRMIYGDGYFYSPQWNYAMTRESRDHFRTALSANGTQVNSCGLGLREVFMGRLKKIF